MATTPQPLPPEIELLLCCARIRLDEKTSQRLRALISNSINWDHLLVVASRHGMMPLLYWHLQQLRPPGIPESFLSQLNASFLENSRHNLLLTEELVNLARLFQSHDVPLLPFKGPTLAVKAYGNVALRQFGDLDVLIHKADFEKAVELLASHGYRPDIQLSQSQTALFLRTQRVLTLVNERHDTLLELHWEINPTYFHVALDEERLWERSERLKLGETELQVLAPTDLLLYLCGHGAKHFWERIEWLGGVGELLRGDKEDVFWDKLLECAYEIKSERTLFLALMLLNDLLAVEIPERILDRVKAEKSVSILARGIEQSYASTAKLSLSLVQRTLFYARLNRNLWDAARYSFRSAITPSDADIRMFALPKAAFFLYRLARPFRLAGRYGVDVK